MQENDKTHALSHLNLPIALPALNVQPRYKLKLSQGTVCSKFVKRSHHF